MTGAENLRELSVLAELIDQDGVAKALGSFKLARHIGIVADRNAHAAPRFLVGGSEKNGASHARLRS